MKRLSAALRALVLSTTMTLAEGASGVDASSWPDRFVARLEALALLQTLNAELLSHDSATLTLDRWCETHHLASPASIVAERDRETDKAPSAEQRDLLHVSPTDAVRYRHVRLRCGAHVLSEADNWYVPARLTAAMNRQLDSSDIAFGRAVKALNFTRQGDRISKQCDEA